MYVNIYLYVAYVSEGMNGKMLFCVRKLQQRLVSHLDMLHYISLHLYYNVKGFSLSPENTILTFMYSCTTSLYVHRILESKLFWMLLEFSYPADGSCGS